MRINIYELVGAVCMTYEDGAKVHAAYRSAFDAGETVELDFNRVRIFVSQFFNAAVGLLLKDYPLEELRGRLRVLNLASSGSDPLKRSVENAERYYRDAKYREALDQVLTAQAAEV